MRGGRPESFLLCVPLALPVFDSARNSITTLAEPVAQVNMVASSACNFAGRPWFSIS